MGTRRNREEQEEVEDIFLHLVTRVDRDTVNSAPPPPSSLTRNMNLMRRTTTRIILLIVYDWVEEYTVPFDLLPGGMSETVLAARIPHAVSTSFCLRQG